MSLQKLLIETEYPPKRPSVMQSRTQKVAMIVESVSPTPFALLRRANHFHYRDEDHALQELSEYEDPVKALTDECRRVLKSISSTNQSQASSGKDSTGLRDASWSRFEDLGFSGTFDDADDEEEGNFLTTKKKPMGLRTAPASGKIDLGRPTTPSWADFLSAGFNDEQKNGPAPLLLPPDKILPPIETSRGMSSQSHHPRLQSDSSLGPGELASITRLNLDDSFWWVWMSSLAGEEPAARKATFGRCALIETVIPGGKWLVMEEIVKGAAPEPEEGAYIAEKKSRFGWTKRSKTKALERSKSMGKQGAESSPNIRQPYKGPQSIGVSKVSIGQDQHARIQAAAAQLQMRHRQQEAQQQALSPQPSIAQRRGRTDFETVSQKTASVFTLQPVIMSEASPAMKWANKYDKDAIREAYLANNTAGRGLEAVANGNGHAHQSSNRNSLEYSRMLDAHNAHSPGPDAGANSPSARSALSPAPFPPTPGAGDNKLALSDTAANVALPGDAQPIERKGVAFTADAHEPSHEAPLTKVQTNASSKSKQNKLKKSGGGGGGFKSLFSRSKSRREPKHPEVDTHDTTNAVEGALQPGGATIGRRFSGFHESPVQANSPVDDHMGDRSPSNLAVDDNNYSTPARSPAGLHDKSYEPSVRESLSHVDTVDAHEARQEFSRFDQGPLEDQPAFAPEDDDEDRVPEANEEENSVEPSLPQDRWAQIRKNAAERAAMRQSEEQSRGGQSYRTGDDDGETSGEESEFSFTILLKIQD
jgi:hypothetical protein